MSTRLALVPQGHDEQSLDGQLPPQAETTSGVRKQAACNQLTVHGRSRVVDSLADGLGASQHHGEHEEHAENDGTHCPAKEKFRGKHMEKPNNLFQQLEARQGGAQQADEPSDKRRGAVTRAGASTRAPPAQRSSGQSAKRKPAKQRSICDVHRLHECTDSTWKARTKPTSFKFARTEISRRLQCCGHLCDCFCHFVAHVF